MVLGIGLLSVVVLFVIGLLTTNFSLQAKGEGAVASAHMAETVMDRWKARPYAELAALVGAGPVDTVETRNGVDYNSRFTVTALQPASLNPENSVLHLEVELSWLAQTGINPDGGRSPVTNRMKVQSVVSPEGTL